jgi:hypothetical protein
VAPQQPSTHPCDNQSETATSWEKLQRKHCYTQSKQNLNYQRQNEREKIEWKTKWNILDSCISRSFNNDELSLKKKTESYICIQKKVFGIKVIIIFI